MTALRPVRYGASAALAGAVTLLLLFTMQSLITGQRGELREAAPGRVVDFVRLRRDAAPEPKKRELPKRAVPQQAPPPPDVQLSNVPDANPIEIAAAMPDFEAALDLGRGAAGGGGGSAEADVVPLVRVNPQYPARAMQRGLEGWVHLQFTISEAGTTKDIEVVEADPVNVFEDAAMAAVRKYKYRPKVENGSPVERPGVEVVLSFKLNK